MTDTQLTDNLFARALELTSPSERQRLLDHACADNAELRRDVETLLDAHEQAGNFLEENSNLPKNVSTIRISMALARSSESADVPPRIPGFRIEGKLGHGGLGVVFEAWDEKLQRKVALKILHTVPNAETRRRVLEEARKIAALRDPGIVTVHAVLDEHEPPAIVMELVEG